MNKIAFYTILFSLLTSALTQTSEDAKTLTRHKGRGEQLQSPSTQARRESQQPSNFNDIPTVKNSTKRARSPQQGVTE